MFAQAGIEQLRVNSLKKSVGVKNVVSGSTAKVALQPIAEVFQEHGHKRGTGPVAGHIGNIYQRLVFSEWKIIEEVAAQV